MWDALVMGSVTSWSILTPAELESAHKNIRMANTSDIKNGMVLNHNNGLLQIVEFLHVKPGKGAAFVRTKLKNIETGKVVDNTFNAGHKIDPVRIETREHTFLYNDDEGYHFMNT